MHQTCSLEARIFKVLLWPLRQKDSPFCPGAGGEIILGSIPSWMTGKVYKSRPYAALWQRRGPSQAGENPSGLAGHVGEGRIEPLWFSCAHAEVRGGRAPGPRRPRRCGKFAPAYRRVPARRLFSNEHDGWKSRRCRMGKSRCNIAETLLLRGR